MCPPGAENWLPIPGYQGWYEVSCCGQVYSMPRNGTSGGLLRVQHNREGVPMVRLSKYGRVRTVSVATLVRATFVI